MNESRISSSILCLLATFCFASCAAHKNTYISQLPPLSTGDLIFLDLDCGDLCDSIENVTLEQFEVSGPRLSHLGIVEVIDGIPSVLEAWSKGGVREVTMESFLGRVNGALNSPEGFYVGRLKPEYRSMGQEAVKRIRVQLGKPYDDVFNWAHDRFYCSELVSFGFAGMEVFKPRPMFFGKRKSKELKRWESYYQDLGVPVPDRELGISPLGIYLEGQKRLFLKN